MKVLKFNTHVIAAFVVVGFWMASPAQSQKPRVNPLRNTSATVLWQSVSFDPGSRIVQGMIEFKGERTIVLTGEQFCGAGSGFIVTEDGEFKENVLRGGSTKQDQIFREICDQAKAKIDEYRQARLRAELEEQRRRENERADQFLMREAECYAFPARCRN